MSTISASTLTGGSSGSITGQLDVQYLVEQLIYAKQQPIRDLEVYETFYTAKKTAFQDLNTKVSALESSLYALNSSAFESKTASVSSETNLTASASTTASNGSYSVIVKQLAAAQSAISGTFASADSQLLSSGKVTIKNYDNTEVLGEVDFSSGTMSLNQLKDQINSMNLDLTATVVNFGTSGSPDYRMQITSDSTGEENGFNIVETGTGNLPGMTTSITAKNAQFYVNTDPVTNPNQYISRASNTVTDVINGVTLNLKQAVDAPLTFSKATVVNVSSNSSAIKEKIQAFVTAFNDVSDFLNKQFAFDTATQKSGVLSGESAAVKVKQDILTMVSSRVGGIDNTDGFKTLGVIGVGLNREGQLEINDEKLDEALTNHIDSVKRLFKDTGSTSNAEIQYIGSSKSSTGGRYQVYVTRAAERAQTQGVDNIDTLGKDETLTITSGGKNVTVNLTTGMTSSDVVEAINTSMTSHELGVFAQVTDGKLEILTEEYGTLQSVSVVSDVASDDAAGSTGIGTTRISDTGVDVAGKFKDSTGATLTASGSGTLLTGTSGGAKGIVASVSTTSIIDTINGDSKGDIYFTRGIAETLRTRASEISFPYTGLLSRNIDTLDSQLSNITDQIKSINLKLASEQEILITQFTKANEALAQMSYLQTTLTNAN